MTRICALVSVFLLVSTVQADKPKKAAAGSCKAENEKAAALSAETTSLRQQLDEARKQLKSTEAKAEKPCSGQEFSVSGIFAKTGAIALSLSDHLLQQTTMDEQVSASFSTATVHARKLTDQITSIDYAGQIKSLKTHPVYLNHFAPHVSKAEELLAPHMATAQAHMDPIIAAAKSHYATALSGLQKNVLPAMKEQSTQVPQLATRINAKVGDLLEPVFKFGAAASPENSGFLPKQPLDRLLFLVFTAVFMYISSKMLVRTVFLICKIVLPLLRLFILLPLNIVRKLVGIWLFFATGFYCCGLCRRKKATVEAKATKSSKESKVMQATVSEITQLLDVSKKQGKIVDGAKTMADLSKSGKPFNKPKNMEGKVLAKETLKQALSKFKEVKVKDLGL